MIKFINKDMSNFRNKVAQKGFVIYSGSHGSYVKFELMPNSYHIQWFPLFLCQKVLLRVTCMSISHVSIARLPSPVVQPISNLDVVLNIFYRYYSDL